jgi:toxin CcdB
MAKFDVYRLKDDDAFVLDCQADLLDGLNIRFVVPLLAEAKAPTPITRLNPIMEVDGNRLVMATQFAAAIPSRALGDVVASLISDQDAIGNAIDMLITGF